MHHATMILEGGATRGVFTSGVLDYLMEIQLLSGSKKIFKRQKFIKYGYDL